MNKRLLAAGAALATVALVQPYRPFVVSGESMTPTFKTGQILVANIRPSHLKRGDIVVFHHNDETMVKRVAYLPGDSIEKFWFADEWKTPNSDRMLKTMIRLKLPSKRSYVPAGHVFVLSDNPYGSVDSREYGPVSSDDIVAVIPDVDPEAEWSIDGAQHGSALVASL